MSLKSGWKLSRWPNLSRKFLASKLRIFSEFAEKISIQEGTKPSSRLTASSEPPSPSGTNSPRGHSIESGQFVEQAGDHCRILAFSVEEQHVAAKERVAAENLVRSFAGEHDLVAGVAHGAAQKVSRDAVRVDAKRLRLHYCIGEVIGQIVLPERNGTELCPRLRGHLPGDFPFVIFGPIEGEGEGANWCAVMPRGQAEDRRGIEPATQIAADRNVGAQANANGLVKHETELGGPVSVRPVRRGSVGTGIVEIPIPVHLHLLLPCDQIMAGRNLEDAVE